MVVEKSKAPAKLFFQNLKMSDDVDDDGGDDEAGLDSQSTTVNVTSEVMTSIRKCLECPSCSDVMKAPVSFRSCGHSFCSLCARSWLSKSQTCPVCNSKQDEGELSHCLALQQIIECFAPGKVVRRVDAEPPTTRPAYMTTVVYHLLNNEQLDELLRDVGLTTRNQTREQKIVAHRELRNMYNAEIDAGNSVVDLGKLRKELSSRRSSVAAAALFGDAAKSKRNVNKVVSEDPFLKTRREARESERKKYRLAKVPAKWRAVYSDFLGRPVYYNQETREITSKVPRERDAEGEEQEDSLKTGVVFLDE